LVGPDIDPLLLNVRAKFSAEGFAGDQVHRAAEFVFQIKLHTEIATGRSGAIKSDKDVNVTACCGSAACGGAE